MAAGTNSFLGEVALIPFNFAPKGWATCDGQLLPISQNTALFSLLGTTYGGNGVSTFGLPNMQGTVAIGAGTSNYGEDFVIGESAGTTTNTLTLANMPAHTHLTANPLYLMAGAGAADTNSPVNNYPAQGGTNLYAATGGGTGNIPMQTSAVTAGTVGSNTAYSNLQTYLGLYYIIAMTGIFPARS